MAEITPEKQPWAVQVANKIDELTKTDRITWGGDGDWRRCRVVAREPLTLSDLEDETREPMALKKGDTAWLDDELDLEKLAYMVTVGSYGKEVPAQSVTVQRPGWQVPDHSSAPIKLMCFELFPYAALRADLMPAGSFFDGLAHRNARRGKDDGSTSWAGFLGADLTVKRQPPGDAAKAARGDIIVLYDDQGSGYHTVIASGATDPEAGTLVYSIADDSKKRPWLCPLATLAKVFLPGATLTSIRVFTPRLPQR